MKPVGSIAFSKCGRDRNRVFVIVGVSDEQHVLIIDGRTRKIDKPKKKKLKHLRIVGYIPELNGITDETAAKITASYHKSLQSEKE